jgi:hypothetical protein
MLAYVLGARSSASPWPVAGASTLGEIPDLAHRHELAEPGGRRGQVLEQPASTQHRGQRARLELVAEPFLLRLLGVDGLVVQPLRQPLEHAAEPLLLRHLAHHHALSTACGGQPEGGGHGRLPDPALARDEHEPLVQ